MLKTQFLDDLIHALLHGIDNDPNITCVVNFDIHVSDEIMHGKQHLRDFLVSFCVFDDATQKNRFETYRIKIYREEESK